MHCVGKTMSDLHALLIDYEKGLKDKTPTPQLCYQPNLANPSSEEDKSKRRISLSPTEELVPWKRNCPLYLEELRTNKNKKAEHGAATSVQYTVNGVFVIGLAHDNVSLGLPICERLHAIASSEGLLEGYTILHKTLLYEFEASITSWNKRFDGGNQEVLDILKIRDEPCVYRRAVGVILKEVKDYLGKCFSMKDLGEAAYILGIKIYRDRSKRLIKLSQSAYIDKILKKFNMHNSKKGYLPMEVKHELSNEMRASTPEEVAYMKKVPYASVVRSIMYAVRCTRPDVAFAQNLVSRYQQNPGKLHWVAVKHILKYLRNTRDVFLVYGGNPELNVTGLCDASWQCDKYDTKSQMGYVFVVNGGALYGLAVWIRKFVGDLGVMPSIKEPINVYCDNSTFANDSGIMKGARHFLQRYHYVREQVKSGEIKVLKVHTDDNLADPFTKALPKGKVTDHANGIGLQLASSFMHTCD
ncbi:retrotransposon protein, putative, ty1-copia subclass [Tanacetum coccineum]